MIQWGAVIVMQFVSGQAETWSRFSHGHLFWIQPDLLKQKRDAAGEDPNIFVTGYSCSPLLVGLFDHDFRCSDQASLVPQVG